MRSIVAVLAGLVATLGLVTIMRSLALAVLDVPPQEPPSADYLVFNLIGSALAGLVGGAVAMKLAPHRPHGHVIALAVVILLLSLPSLLASPVPAQPVWYDILIRIVGPLSVLVGGLIGVRWRHEPTGVDS